MVVVHATMELLGQAHQAVAAVDQHGVQRLGLAAQIVNGLRAGVTQRVHRLGQALRTAADPVVERLRADQSV